MLEKPALVGGNEQNITLAEAPYGGNYKIVDKFLIVPNVPLSAGDSISNTLIGKNAGVESTTTLDVRWVADSAASITGVDAPPEKGTLALKLIQ